MHAEAILKQMTLEEKAAFCSGMDFWHTKALPRLGVPSLMMCDGPHGLRKQVNGGDHLGIGKSIETVCYPAASALAASFDREALKALGEALGQECQAENVAMLLGPGLNIKRSPLCGRNFEYLSEDPYLAGELGAAYVQALQSKGISACAKHFACNNQETRRMSGSSQLDERTLREIYLPAFENVVKNGKTHAVMCAYNAVNGEFCAENKQLLNDILRDKWGFDGIVVTDWGAIKDRAKAVQSGVDLEMPGGPGATGEAIAEAVRRGELSEAELDQAVLRLLRFIQRAEAEHVKGAAIDRQDCRKLAQQLACECAVLLKNEGILPLKKEQNVVFIGEFAKTPRYQGAGSSHINVLHPLGAKEAAGGMAAWVRGFDAHSTKTDEVLLAEAIAAAKQAEIAVVFAGLPDAFETEGADRDHMRLPSNQNELISAVASVNPRTVVVLHGGSPVELPWIDRVPAVLCMYLGGEQVGAAAVDLLWGQVNPSGHLAETWPLRLQDNPSYLNFPGEDGIVSYSEGIYVGYRYYDKKEMPVLFPFGHGLSYTHFTYHSLKVSADQIREDETLYVEVDVTNDGPVAGKTVVQLYIRDKESTVRRPVRELRGFTKVELKPGETKTVRFSLSSRDFAYWETAIHDWFVESGEFVLEIGESSRALQAEKTIWVNGMKSIPFVITETTCVAQLLRHPKGAVFARQMMAASPSSSDPGTAMGEGADRMMKAMMLDMPLGALVSYGRMSHEQLKILIAKLNEP